MSEAGARGPDARDASSYQPVPGRPGRGRGVTLRDVADRAGVSVATVSFVVNGKTGVSISDATREKVRAAIAEMGYRPNVMAQSLARGGSSFLGLVADGIATTPFAGQIIRGAQDEAWKHGHVLLVADVGGNRQAEEKTIAMLLEHQVRGVLYSTWYHRALTPPPSLREVPYVLVNCFSEEGRAPAVIPDEEQGGRAATELLLAAGHRHVAFVNSVLDAPATTGRLRGYHAALDAAGIEPAERVVLEAGPDQEGGYGVFEAVRASGVSGVFCYNDRMAMGLLDAARERGIRIPEDLSVVGFDNQEVIAEHTRPPLSTVALPHYEMGARAVLDLLDALDQSRAPAHSSFEPVRLPCPPVSRESIREETA